jgi:hypothetical protein
MTSHHEMAALFGGLLGQRGTANLAMQRWGSGVSDSDAVQSTAAVLVLARNTFADSYRNNRPKESIFWHNFRVADAVHQNNAHVEPRLRLMKTFMAAAHDLCEDSRKLTPQTPIMPAHIAALWKGSAQEKQLIVDVLTLKTDAAGLEGDARRAAQHQRVSEVRSGQHGEAGKIYVELMAADKKDNLTADLTDMQAGRLHFATRSQGLEFVFKKIADAQIVKALPVDAAVKKDFQDTYETMMARLIVHKIVPTTNEIISQSDARHREQLVRAHLSGTNPFNAKDAQFYVQSTNQKLHVLNQDYKRLHTGTVKFKTRAHGLEYAFAHTADALTVRAAPVAEPLRTKFNTIYDGIMTELLYAGSIKPTMVAHENTTVPYVYKNRRPSRAGRLTALTHHI